MDITMSPEELEGRLAAQRQVLRWILERMVVDGETFADLRTHVDGAYPPLDHQEDPGAVPTQAFGTVAATGLELRLLLDPLAARFGR